MKKVQPHRVSHVNANRARKGLLAELPTLDSRCNIGPDEALTIRNLKLGAVAARKEDMKCENDF